MTFPPCYEPPDDEPDDPSRRTFMIGSAVATAGLFISPTLPAQASLRNPGRQQGDRLKNQNAM